MSKDDRPSAEAVAANIADFLRADPEAEKAFRADPAKFFEVSFGQPLPPGMRVEIHDNTDTVWHIPVGQPPGPIDDLDMASVDGGFGALSHYFNQRVKEKTGKAPGRGLSSNAVFARPRDCR